VFILRNLTIIHVIQGRLGVDTADVHQVLERGAVFHFTYLLQPSPAPRQCPEILLDGGIQFFSTRVPNRFVVPIKLHHVMRTIRRIPDLPLAPYCAECLDGVLFVLFHLGLVFVVVEWNSVACVYFIPVHRVSIQILDWHDGVCLAAQLTFIASHHFSHSSSDVAQSYVNASCVHAGLSGLADTLEQVVESWVERHSECTVYNTSVNVRTLVNFQDIALLQDNIIPRVGSVMSSTFIYADSRWKCIACFEF